MTVVVQQAGLDNYRILFLNATTGNAVEITPATRLVLGLRTRHGYDQRIAEAEIRVTSVPSGIGYLDRVLLEAGATSPTRALRFWGKILEFNTTLYPGEVIIVCRGPLIDVERYEQPNAGGSAMEGAAGTTDTAMVGSVLTTAGVAVVPGYTVSGTGRIFGGPSGAPTVTDSQGNLVGPFVWQEGESGLAFIERLDEISVAQDANGVWGAYRTYDGRDGMIRRSLVSVSPGTPTAFTFTEGLDIERGNLQASVLDQKNRARVTGVDDGTGLGAVSFTATQANPIGDPESSYRTVTLSNSMIEFGSAAETGGTAGVSAEEECYYLLGHHNRIPHRVPFTTTRDDVVHPAQRFTVTSPTGLGITEQFWCQSVEDVLDERGWSTNLVGIGGIVSSAPFLGEVEAGFAMVVEQETVVLSGAEGTVYLVHCRDSSYSPSGTIATYSWTATGGTPSSGALSHFTTVYGNLTSRTITLAVIDSTGATGSVSRGVPTTSQQQPVQRGLYLAGSTELGSYDPTASTWRTKAATAGTVVANGPLFADGDKILYSTDYGATFGTATPKPGVNVSSLWFETDVSLTRCLGGWEDGEVMTSADGGPTWTTAGTPEASPILRVVVNRYSPDLTQWFAMTASAYYDTVDGGASWTALQSAEVGETFRDVAHHYDRGYMVVMAGGRLAIDSSGVQQTITGSNGTIVAVCPRVGGGYAVYDSAGKTYLSENGAAIFTATASPLPTGSGFVVQPRGLWLDRGIKDLYYIAGGTAGAYKSVDGFGSAGGYFTIRVPGVGSAPVGAVYTQVGADGLLTTPTIVSTTIVGTTGNTKALSLWNGASNDAAPANWFDSSYDHSAWSAAATATYNTGSPYFQSLPPGTNPLWASSLPANANEDVLLYCTFTLPAGRLNSVSLTIGADADGTSAFGLSASADGFHCNSRFVSFSTPAGASMQQGGTTVTLPADAFTPGATNVFALYANGATAPYSWVAFKLVFN